jgi:hypothetical protein
VIESRVVGGKTREREQRFVSFRAAAKTRDGLGYAQRLREQGGDQTVKFAREKRRMSDNWAEIRLDWTKRLIPNHGPALA